MLRKVAWFFGAFLISTCVLAQSSPSAPSASNSGTTIAADPVNDSSPVPQDSTRLVVVHKEPAYYPGAAERDRRQGQVLVKMYIDEAGNVTEAEALSGDELFREPALKAARKWKFQPYIRGGKPIKVATTIPFDFAFRDNVNDQPVALSPLNPGSSPSPATAQGSSSTQGSGAGLAPVRIRVGQAVSQGMLIHRVNPVYPPDAKQYGITGQVVLQAVIGKDGTVRNLRVISGHSKLAQSAVDAVQQWRYKPYFLNGQPVEVDTQITVNFTMSR